MNKAHSIIKSETGQKQCAFLKNAGTINTVFGGRRTSVFVVVRVAASVIVDLRKKSSRNRGRKSN